MISAVMAWVVMKAARSVEFMRRLTADNGRRHGVGRHMQRLVIERCLLHAGWEARNEIDQFHFVSVKFIIESPLWWQSPRLPQNTIGADVSVLDIGRCLTLKAESSIPVENNVLG